MYRRILLAYDGSVEGRRALREGALLALSCKAEVYLLSVVPGSAGSLIAEGAYAGTIDRQEKQLRFVFDEGVERLRQMGFKPVARLVSGDPSQEICAFANEVRADLVVVGHRRKSLLERWWSGSSGAWLSDQLKCSLLVSRNVVSDDAFEKEVSTADDRALGEA
jgi:nucleotide-binding universal stress UspA family protein